MNGGIQYVKVISSDDDDRTILMAIMINVMSKCKCTIRNEDVEYNLM